MEDRIDEKLLIEIKKNLEYYTSPLESPESVVDLKVLSVQHELMREESNRIIQIIKNSLDL